MKIGDLVRPRSNSFRDQIGMVVALGFMRGFGGIRVRLLTGRIATFNRGSLEIINEA